MRKITLMVIMIFSLAQMVWANPQDSITGLWTFQDTNNLTKADIGQDLTLIGTMTSVPGKDAADNAVQIGIGSHLVCNHNIAPNGGGNYVNQWSLMIDFSYPQSSAGKWMCFFQTAPANNNDGDCFVRGSGGILGSLGLAATGYSSIATQPDTWYRMIVSVSNGNFYRIHIDGVLWLEGTVQAIDGRFSLEPQLLLFADDNGEDYPMNVSTVAMFNKALTAEDVAYFSDDDDDIDLDPTGKWLFDDANNLTKATKGQDLTLVGNISTVDGIDANDGAAQIGIGSYFVCNHNIEPNGGGTKINQWSLLVDFSYPQSSAGQWMCFFQTHPSNSDDGDCFIRSGSRAIGVAATGYSALSTQPDTWYRMIVSVSNGNFYRIYINGVLWLDGTVQSVDGRFSLAPTLLIFADNDGEDNPINVSKIAIYDKALSQQQATALKGPGGNEPDPQDLVLTKPYLQNVKQDGITIMWELSEQKNSVIEYGIGDYTLQATSTNIASGAGTYIYKAILTGLQPGTHYNYRLVINDYPQEDKAFKTAPIGYANFKVGIWADSQGTNRNDYPADLLEPVKSIMAHMGEFADIAVSSGDLAENGNAYGDTRTYYLDRVAKNLGQANVPWFNAWGNHDSSAGSVIRRFADMPSKDRGSPFHPGYGNFAFMYAGCSFICIDDLERTNMVWVENELQMALANNARFIFVFVHRSPYFERWYDGDSFLRTNLVPLLEQYQADALFTGHMHGYQRGYKNGVYYVVNGGCGWLDHHEPLTTNWPHMTVGGYTNTWAHFGITGGLVHGYTQMEIDEFGFQATMVGFHPDGRVWQGVTDVYGKVDLLADVNNDGYVDLKDFNAISKNWLSHSLQLQIGDVNGDGVVDIKDLMIFSNSWLYE